VCPASTEKRSPEAQNASISVWLIFVHFSFIFRLNPIRDIPIAISACCALGRSHIINYNSVRKARLAPHRWRHFRAVPCSTETSVRSRPRHLATPVRNKAPWSLEPKGLNGSKKDGRQ